MSLCEALVHRMDRCRKKARRRRLSKRRRRASVRAPRRGGVASFRLCCVYPQPKWSGAVRSKAEKHQREARSAAVCETAIGALTRCLRQHQRLHSLTSSPSSCHRPRCLAGGGPSPARLSLFYDYKAAPSHSTLHFCSGANRDASTHTFQTLCA